MPDLVLTSDVIIGFPGETGGEAMETVDLVRQVEFDAPVHLHLLSPGPARRRPKWTTRAPGRRSRSGLTPSAPHRVTYSARHHARYVGKTLRCLVDGETDDSRWPLSARTGRGRLVHLVGDRDALGQYRDVRDHRQQHLGAVWRDGITNIYHIMSWRGRFCVRGNP